jgi:DNA-binding NtrC family response regulator
MTAGAAIRPYCSECRAPQPGKKLGSIRALFVEDSKYAVDLGILELKRGGFDVQWSWTNNEDEMRQLLENGKWDIIISDNSTPQFNALQALAATKRFAPAIPFIIVSEDVSPEVISFAMQNGCCAYLLKENQHQLAILVKNIINCPAAKPRGIEDAGSLPR